MLEYFFEFWNVQRVADIPAPHVVTRKCSLPLAGKYRSVDKDFVCLHVPLTFAAAAMAYLGTGVNPTRLVYTYM
jgi:hypothetical protein